MRTESRKYRAGGFVAFALVLIAMSAVSVSCAAVPDREEGSNDRFAAKVKEMSTAVHCVAAGLGGLSSEPDFVGVIRKFIDPIRFFADSTGYFFIYDTKGVVIGHAADKDLIGKNLYDLQDKTGKYFIRDKIAAARAGGGFVDYYWPDPQTKEVKKKRVYVEMIPGTDYLIGSGVYFD